MSVEQPTAWQEPSTWILACDPGVKNLGLTLFEVRGAEDKGYLSKPVNASVFVRHMECTSINSHALKATEDLHKTFERILMDFQPNDQLHVVIEQQRVQLKWVVVAIEAAVARITEMKRPLVTIQAPGTKFKFVRDEDDTDDKKTYKQRKKRAVDQAMRILNIQDASTFSGKKKDDIADSFLMAYSAVHLLYPPPNQIFFNIPNTTEMTELLNVKPVFNKPQSKEKKEEKKKEKKPRKKRALSDEICGTTNEQDVCGPFGCPTGERDELGRLITTADEEVIEIGCSDDKYHKRLKVEPDQTGHKERFAVPH